MKKAADERFVLSKLLTDGWQESALRVGEVGVKVKDFVRFPTGL